jgi:DivIVA domain-containing protein
MTTPPLTPPTLAADLPAFPLAAGRERGYERAAVDAFLARARAAFEADSSTDALTAADVRRTAFPLVKRGYSVIAVDAALGRVEDAFAARARESALVASGTQAWIEDARSQAQVILDRLNRPAGRRFARAGFWRYGYRVDEVDIVADRIAGFLASGESVSVDQVRAVAFRMQRRGYREAQVDAVLDVVVEVMLAVG